MAAPFMSETEAMKTLGVDAPTFKTLLNNQQLREFRDAGKKFFKTEEVNELAAKLSPVGHWPSKPILISFTNALARFNLSTQQLQGLIGNGLTVYLDENELEKLLVPDAFKKTNDKQIEFIVEALNQNGEERMQRIWAKDLTEAVDKARKEGLFPTSAILAQKVVSKNLIQKIGDMFK